jgi:hypothetical protein
MPHPIESTPLLSPSPNVSVHNAETTIAIDPEPQAAINPITNPEQAAAQIMLTTQQLADSLEPLQPLSRWTHLLARGDNRFVQLCLLSGMVAGVIASAQLWPQDHVSSSLVLVSTVLLTGVPYLAIGYAHGLVIVQEIAERVVGNKDVTIALLGIFKRYLSDLGIERLENMTLTLMRSPQGISAAAQASNSLQALRQDIGDQEELSPINKLFMLSLEFVMRVTEDPIAALQAFTARQPAGVLENLG